MLLLRIVTIQYLQVVGDYTGNLGAPGVSKA